MQRRFNVSISILRTYYSFKLTIAVYGFYSFLFIASFVTFHCVTLVVSLLKTINVAFMYQLYSCILISHEHDTSGTHAVCGRLRRSEGFDLGSRHMTSVGPFTAASKNDAMNLDNEVADLKLGSPGEFSCYKSYLRGSMYFPDAPKKRIDYVLVYCIAEDDAHKKTNKATAPLETDGVKHQGKLAKRQHFERNLKALGLELKECKSLAKFEVCFDTCAIQFVVEAS
uniref:T5orf172 domain-containing protein n=1 Tax=Syphacia muris TaxID=451379 RepID=A0A0N5A9A3_9BILA